jgi:hypothetical protein
MLWVAWLVIMADHKIADNEALLIRHLVRLARDQHQVVDSSSPASLTSTAPKCGGTWTPSQGT